MEQRFSSLEASLEHLRGAYEQLDKRVGDLRTDVAASFVKVDQRFDAVDRTIDGNLKTLITWMLGQTAIIIGSLASLALALRH